MRHHLHKIHHKLIERSPQGILIRICLYLIVAFIIFSGMMYHANKAKAAIQAQLQTASQVQAAQTSKESTIVSNTILVRLKKASKTKVNKQSTLDSNILGIKELKKKYNIKNFEQLAKQSSDSNTNADIFSWYQITLDEKPERIKARYDSKNKRLTSAHAKGKQLQNVIDTVKTDPDIELIEPVYLVSINQTDTIPPTAPTNLTATAVNSTSIRIQWNASTDNFGVANYEIIRNGVLYLKLPNATSTNLTMAGLTPNTAYTFNVRAKDLAGNTSAQSNSATATTTTVTNTPTPTPVVIGSSAPTPTSIIIGSSAPTPTGIGASFPYYVPNDPYYSSSGTWGQTYDDMWGMKRINAENAWRETRGSQSIIVAVIDTGIDKNHPDLVNNMWLNSNEIIGNGIDDDANGYVDDSSGWDFAANTNNPTDDYGHGTDVAGVIAAIGNNNIGVVGVNWSARIMNLKFIPSGGYGDISNAIRAIQYGADMGADVLNNSWGAAYAYRYAPLEDALKYAHDYGVVIVVSAGNDGINALDAIPASSPYVITAAAIDQNDVRSVWGSASSNYGEKIDVTAPGSNILTTRGSTGTHCPYIVASQYCRTNGTSFSSPHTAGLAALLLSLQPSLTNEQVRQNLRSSATDLGTAGKDSDFGYGRIDAGSSIRVGYSNPNILAPFIASPQSKTTVSGNTEVIGTINGSNLGNYKLEIGAGRSPSTWNLQIQSSAPVTNGVLATIRTTDFPGGTYTIKLTAFDKTGKKYEFQIYDVTINNTPTVTPTLTNTPSPTAPTFTPTPTLTNTPTPTPTPIPVPIISCNPVANGIAWSWNEVPNSTYWLQVDSSDSSQWLFNDWVATTTYTTTNATPGVTYRGRVLAGDGIQQSTFSNYTFCTVPVPTNTPTPTPDLQGPVVNITSPLNNAIVTRNTTITIQATATDPAGVARVEFRVNGNRICNDTAAPYSCNWKVPNRKRTHTITVSGYDVINNMTATSIQITAQ